MLYGMLRCFGQDYSASLSDVCRHAGEEIHLSSTRAAGREPLHPIRVSCISLNKSRASRNLFFLFTARPPTQIFDSLNIHNSAGDSDEWSRLYTTLKPSSRGPCFAESFHDQMMTYSHGNMLQRRELLLQY